MINLEFEIRQAMDNEDSSDLQVAGDVMAICVRYIAEQAEITNQYLLEGMSRLVQIEAKLDLNGIK